MSRRVFSLAPGGLGPAMTLEFAPGVIRAFDSTGYLVASAYHVNNRGGWAITIDRHIVSMYRHKSEAETGLRKIVGGRETP